MTMVFCQRHKQIGPRQSTYTEERVFFVKRKKRTRRRKEENFSCLSLSSVESRPPQASHQHLVEAHIICEGKVLAVKGQLGVRSTHVSFFGRAAHGSSRPMWDGASRGPPQQTRSFFFYERALLLRPGGRLGGSPKFPPWQRFFQGAERQCLAPERMERRSLTVKPRKVEKSPPF